MVLTDQQKVHFALSPNHLNCVINTYFS